MKHLQYFRHGMTGEWIVLFRTAAVGSRYRGESYVQDDFGNLVPARQVKL